MILGAAGNPYVQGHKSVLNGRSFSRAARIFFIPIFVIPSRPEPRLRDGDVRGICSFLLFTKQFSRAAQSRINPGL
jgi:hypothetical protein